MGIAETVFAAVARTAADVRGALAERRTYRDDANPTGDRQLAADIYADDLFENRLLAIDNVSSYASEERETVSQAPDGGDYHVACDPLDGSSNLKSNNAMGTIVGVYDDPLPTAGDSLIAAGYVLYGPITTMVTATDGHVTEYLLEGDERSALDDDLELADEPTVYGFGGRIPDWTDDFRAYVDAVEADRLKLRYGGAMVADVNQVLTYGGIFGYPMLTDSPEGKLRLQFESHPIGYIIEAAGGASSDGNGSLLARTPERLHERSPTFVGNVGLIDQLESAIAE